MIEVRPFRECDRQRFDTYVSAHTAATPYHRSAWLAAIEEAYGHRCWVVSLEDDDDVRGLLPLCVVKSPFTRPRLVSLPFCDLGGPLAQDAASKEQLVAGAHGLCRELKADYLELRSPGPALAPTLVDAPEGGKVSMICELAADAETLFAGFKPKLRSQIRKAEKNGISAEVLPAREALEGFYPVFAQNMQRLGSPVHSQRWFQCLAKEYGTSMVAGLARFEGQVVGAAILLLNGSRATVPWASTLAEFNRLAPNMLLYWSMIAWASDHGYDHFDFGRSTPGEGTYRFKRQWGAEPHVLRWARYSSQSSVEEEVPGISMASRVRTLAESLWQHLPLSLANQIGPKIRKHVTL